MWIEDQTGKLFNTDNIVMFWIYIEEDENNTDYFVKVLTSEDDPPYTFAEFKTKQETDFYFENLKKLLQSVNPTK